MHLTVETVSPGFDAVAVAGLLHGEGIGSVVVEDSEARGAADSRTQSGDDDLVGIVTKSATD